MKRSTVATLLLSAAATTVLGANAPDRDARARALPQFGGAVAIAGNDVFVGEPTGPKAGVHLYRRSPTGWKLVAALPYPGEAGTNAGFGSTLSTDGTTLLVSQVSQQTVDSGRGKVWAFRKGADGQWVSAGQLGGGVAARATYGLATAVQGDVAVIGSPGADFNNGQVSVYRRGAGGAWALDTKLTVDSLAPNDRFGASVALDGSRLAIGAVGREGKGRVYTFWRGTDGKWQKGESLQPRTAPQNGNFGMSVALAGDRLLVGAPAVSTPAAPVAAFAVLYEWDGRTSKWAEKGTFTPFEVGTSGFGRSVGVTPNELWIGAPTADRGIGRVYRVRRDKAGTWSDMSKLVLDSVETGAGFGATFAMQGDVAVVGMPGDGGTGSVTFLGRTPTGTWARRGTAFIAPEEKYTAVRGKAGKGVDCTDGKAGAFGCGNTELLSFLPISQIGGGRGVGISGMWGWTDPVTGRDYALIGRTDGTAFVDVTDPSNPKYLGDMMRTKGTPKTSWRELKTYKNWVLVSSDNSPGHGIQFFDLTRLRTVKTPQHFEPDYTYDRLGSVHNVVVNEESGFAYAVGAREVEEACGGGLHMIDVRNPRAPKFAGCAQDKETGRSKTGYTHDAQCVTYRGPDKRYTGHEICIASNETMISVQDVTDKANPKVLARSAYPTVGYTHQTWFTDDQKYMYLNDELDESGKLGKSAEGSRTIVWDMTDLQDPVMVQEFIGTTKAIDHNLYIKGDRMYQSNYTAGLRILDISDPRNPREVGFLDTYPDNDATSFAGTWSNYPFFKNGSIGVVGIGEGLFLVKDKTKGVVP